MPAGISYSAGVSLKISGFQQKSGFTGPSRKKFFPLFNILSPSCRLAALARRYNNIDYYYYYYCSHTLPSLHAEYFCQMAPALALLPGMTWKKWGLKGTKWELICCLNALTCWTPLQWWVVQWKSYLANCCRKSCEVLAQWLLIIA